VDIDILKPHSGYHSVERPSQTSSSRGTSERLVKSDSSTPDIDRSTPYAEPVSDGDDDEEMDIHPAKDEHKRTGLSSVDVAEAIAFIEKMLKERAQVAQPRVKSTKQINGEEASHAGDGNDGKSKNISIDPLAPSTAFDETLRSRLKKAAGRSGSTLAERTTENQDEHVDLEALQWNERADDRELVREWTAPSGKKIAVPIRIEPKVYFAAERTFLVFFSFAFIHRILKRFWAEMVEHCNLHRNNCNHPSKFCSA
jgi:hypothetical protein